MKQYKPLASGLSITRRKMLGFLLLGTGSLLTFLRMPALGQQATQKGNVLLDRILDYPSGLEDAAKFPLMDALYGR